MRRTLLVLVAVIGAVALLSGCGKAGSPYAATVESSQISRAELNDDLTALSDNTKFVDSLKKQQNVEVNVTDGGVNTGLSSQWLNILVNQSLIDQEFESRHLKVSPKNVSDGKTAAEATFGGATIFNVFPKWFRDAMIKRQQRVEAVSDSLPPDAAATDAELQQFFESTVKASCPSNTLVEHILVPTRAEADQIETQLAQGANFETLAKQRSTDTASAPIGGLLYCTASQQFVNGDKTFATAAAATPVGSISAPVQTSAGFHIIKMAPWTFENTRPIVEQAYAEQRQTPLDKLLIKRLEHANIWIDPRYGTLRRENGTVNIVPPKAPAPKSKPPTATASTLPATSP